MTKGTDDAGSGGPLRTGLLVLILALQGMTLRYAALVPEATNDEIRRADHASLPGAVREIGRLLEEPEMTLKSTGRSGTNVYEVVTVRDENETVAEWMARHAAKKQEIANEDSGVQWAT